MMTSLDGMPTVADGITAKKRWWRRVSIDDPAFHKIAQKKSASGYVYEASDMNLPQIPITMQVFKII